MMKKGDDEDDEVRTTAKPQVRVTVKWELKNLSFGLSIYSQISPSACLPQNSRGRREGLVLTSHQPGKGGGKQEMVGHPGIFFAMICFLLTSGRLGLMIPLHGLHTWNPNMKHKHTHTDLTSQPAYH
jgi:hypothetical protein